MAETPELTAEEISTLKDVANSINGEADIDQLAQVTGVSRRTILKIGAALGVGGIVGGGAASELVGEAQAAPDTTDGDGNVGLPDDRVDVFADGVDGNSVITASLNGGGPLSDGDGTERQIWVIANGASDPPGADPEDIILEEQ